jgi:uncharacterized protein (DUF1697 family)
VSPAVPASRYVAFLRAINVAGHGLIKMSDLRDAFATSGASAVKTYIQSGNVVFDAARETAPLVFKRVHTRLRAMLGEEPVVMYRQARALERVLLLDPFKDVRAESGVKIYVTFLLHKPKAMPTPPVVWHKERIEALAIEGLDLFVVSRPLEDGRYGFPNLPVEKTLGVPATSRNWNTLRRVVDLARG